ncbi:MAG: CoA pyrophosphatase [Propionibacteriaceae bacterium]|nr:CoA pyrophosphatase [Propionibacteriaceae bacterium]
MPGLAALRDALAEGRVARLGQFGAAPKDARQAAVLILLSDEPSPTVLLTERSPGLRAHAGQISFPGGGLEDGEDAVAGALREAREEVGLPGDGVEPIGCLPSAWVPVSGYEVTPVVAAWQQPTELIPSDPSEVAGVMRLPLEQLSDPAVRVTASLPGGYRGPAFELGEWFVWGLTAHLLDATLTVGGWARPWDRDRLRAVPDRFLRD